MIIPDVNLLIYAVDCDAPTHEPARLWLEAILRDDRPVGLAWVVALAFLRLTTHRAVFARPLSVPRAVEVVDAWVTHPMVRPLGPSPQHWGVLRGLLRATGAGAKLTSDAHLAALAIENNATLASADHDFARFPGLDFVNPLRRTN